MTLRFESEPLFFDGSPCMIQASAFAEAVTCEPQFTCGGACTVHVREAGD